MANTGWVSALWTTWWSSWRCGRGRWMKSLTPTHRPAQRTSEPVLHGTAACWLGPVHTYTLPHLSTVCSCFLCHYCWGVFFFFFFHFWVHSFLSSILSSWFTCLCTVFLVCHIASFCLSCMSLYILFFFSPPPLCTLFVLSICSLLSQSLYHFYFLVCLICWNGWRLIPVHFIYAQFY